jgi:hypothetical protein
MNTPSANVNSSPFADQLAQLEANGFPKNPKIVKLLLRTNGNVEVVQKFLIAKIALKNATEKKRK